MQTGIQTLQTAIKNNDTHKKGTLDHVLLPLQCPSNRSMVISPEPPKWGIHCQ